MFLLQIIGKFNVSVFDPGSESSPLLPQHRPEQYTTTVIPLLPEEMGKTAETVETSTERARVESRYEVIGRYQIPVMLPAFKQE